MKELLKFCEILQKSTKLKNLRGNSATNPPCVWFFVRFKIYQKIDKSCLFGPWASVYRLFLALNGLRGTVIDNS